MNRPRCLAAALLFAAAPLAAQEIRYAPGEYKYSVVTVIKRTDIKGAQKQQYTVTADQKMSLLLAARGADSLRFRLTLDAYTLGSDLPIQLPNVAKLQGTIVECAMSATGRMGHCTHRSPAAPGADVLGLAENLSRFLVTLPANVADGRSTTDTATRRSSNDGSDLTERTITTTSVDGDTLFAGVKAWRVRRRIVVSAQGSGAQAGQAVQIASDATASGTYYVSTRGVYLGARTTSRSTTTLTFPDGTSAMGVQDATSTIATIK